jgi:hypothetical protein
MWNVHSKNSKEENIPRNARRTVIPDFIVTSKRSVREKLM